jgi:signal transduction histidine kinase
MSTRGEPPGRTILPVLAADAAVAVLAPPRLPAGTIARVPLARRAGSAAVPVLLAMPAGAGRLLLARALHALAARGGPLVATTGRRPRLDALPAGATLHLDVGALAPEALLALEAVLDDGAVWLVAGAEPGVDLPPALAVRLATVVLDVPPLAARGAELPALAADALARLAARAGAPAPRLAPSALERLAAHAWPGDLAELEATLARAMLVADGGVIEADHLALAAPPPAAPRAVPSASPEVAGAAAELEFLLAELAHELRNPMVTIKTYARHLPALLEDADLRARFETLANDAIDRMDGLLENVLAFARLGVPRAEPVDVGPLLDRVLADVEPELTGRSVQVQHTAGPSARCAADPEHLAYALRNLFAGVVREVPAQERLALEATANGVVTLRFAAGAGAADRLRRLAAPGDDASLADPTLQPLSFRLARAVLERNGGALTVVPEAGDATSVVIRLPTAHVEEVP